MNGVTADTKSKDNNYFSNSDRKTMFKDFKKKIENYLQMKDSNDQCLEEIEPKFFEIFVEEILLHTLELLSLSEDENEFLYCSCEKILQKLVDFSNPAELILFINGQLCIQEVDKCFYLLLNPLRLCLVKSKDVSLVIDMCSEAIVKFLRSLPLPYDESNENEVKNKISAEEERIIKCYQHVLIFTETLLKDLEVYFQQKSFDKISKAKNIIMDFAVSLFGVPLCYLSEENIFVNNIHIQLRNILSSMRYDKLYLLRCMKGFQYFENYSSILDEQGKYLLKKFQDGPLVLADNLALSNYFCSLFSSENVPILSVYNPLYVIASFLNIANFIIQQEIKKVFMCFKAMNLVHKVFNEFKNVSVSAEWLALPIFKVFFNNLFNIMLFQGPVNGKMALSIFSKYMDIFEAEAKFLILLKLLNSDIYTFAKGVLIRKIKDILLKTFYEIESCKCESRELFSGSNLKLLMLSVCKFNKDCDDIVDRQDELNSALNLILYVVLRDKKNISGIKDFIGDLEKKFMQPLSQAVQKEQKFWSCRYDELLEENGKPEFIVCGENLTGLPLLEKLKVCKDIENAMSLIDMVLCRIYEQLNLNNENNTT